MHLQHLLIATCQRWRRGIFRGFVSCDDLLFFLHQGPGLADLQILFADWLNRLPPRDVSRELVADWLRGGASFRLFLGVGRDVADGAALGGRGLGHEKGAIGENLGLFRGPNHARRGWGRGRGPEGRGVGGSGFGQGDAAAKVDVASRRSVDQGKFISAVKCF
jgi:hypothetical protein